MTNNFMRILFAIWVMFIFSLSLVPLKVKIHLGTTGHWHNAGHFFIFLVATLLACRIVSGGGLYAKLICCAGVAGIAFTMEWLEKVSYHIPYEWRDIWFDSIGIAFGMLLILFLPAALSSNVKRAAPTSV